MATPLKLFEIIDKFLKFMDFVQSASPQTLRAYRSDLRQIFHFPADLSTAGKGPKTSETALLDAARTGMTGWGKLSPASRNRKSATLKSFFNYLHQEGLTKTNLAERIVCPQVPRKLPHYLSVDEITAVLTTLRAQGSPLARQRLALVLLLYGGGLRVSEACSLKWRDIDDGRRLIRVLGKGGKQRLIPLPATSLETLRSIKTDGAYVFGDVALPTRTAYEWVRRCGVEAGLTQQLHPHALRHSYATHLLGGGANLRTLQELLGHESLRATEKYTHLGIDQLARTLETHHPLGTGSASRRRRAG